MPAPNPLRVATLRAAALLLADAAEALPGEPLTVHLTDGYHDVRIVVEPVRWSLADQQQQERAGGSSIRLIESPAPPHLTPLDRLILERAPADPVTMMRLARLAGDHDADSYFAARVRRLVALGLMARDYRGFRRA